MVQLRRYQCRLWMIGRRSITLLHSAILATLLIGFWGAVPADAQEPAPAASAAPPRIEVASIKPGRPGDDNSRFKTSTDRITTENHTLRDLIAFAYDLERNSQVLGGPAWLDERHFDIVAIAGDAEIAKLRSMPANDRRKEWGVILQPLLAERFRLKASRGERTLPVYTLVVTKSGSKLKGAAASDKLQGTSWGDRQMTWKATSMDALAYYLTRVEGRVVLDRTGLAGLYDFTLNWSWNEDPSSDSYAADLMTALREQLGLELKATKAPVDVVIVESASEPSLD